MLLAFWLPSNVNWSLCHVLWEAAAVGEALSQPIRSILRRHSAEVQASFPSPPRTCYLRTGAFKGQLRTYYLGT